VLVVHFGDIVVQTEVHLANARLPLDRLSILLEVLGGRASLLSWYVHILADAVIGIIISAEGHPASWADTRVRVLAHPPALNSVSKHYSLLLI